MHLYSMATERELEEIYAIQNYEVEMYEKWERGTARQ